MGTSRRLTADKEIIPNAVSLQENSLAQDVATATTADGSTKRSGRYIGCSTLVSHYYKTGSSHDFMPTPKFPKASGKLALGKECLSRGEAIRMEWHLSYVSWCWEEGCGHR